MIAANRSASRFIKTVMMCLFDMATYIDNARLRFGRMKMCHMIADTLDELHEMAGRIGMKREWFQVDPSWPHYAVSLSRRNKAIEFGAVELTSRELFVKIRELSQQ